MIRYEYIAVSSSSVLQTLFFLFDYLAYMKSVGYGPSSVYAVQMLGFNMDWTTCT